MSKPRFRPLVEPLENRLTPAGNVTAQVIGGSLFVSGDAQNNAIVITQPAPGRFTIAGEEETTVNGSAAPVTLRNATRDVRVALAGGDDRVRFGTFTLEDVIVVGRELRVEGGPGTNVVETLGTLTVGSDFRVTNPAVGVTSLNATTTVGGDLTVTNGAGNSLTFLTPFSADNNAIRGDLRITNGVGDHFNQVEDTNVGGEVVFDNVGRDEFTFTQNYFTTVDSPDRVTVGGDVRYRNRTGGATNHLSNANVRSDVSFSNTGPGLQNHQISFASVRGDVSARSDGESRVEFSEVAIRGGLTVLTGGEDDVIELDNLDARRPTGIATGGGADEVTFDDTLFFGPFGLATGSGNDVVRIESGTDSTQVDPADFLGLVGVFLGDGDDTLQLGAFGDPTRLVRLRAAALFDGGPGFDVLDPAKVDAAPGRVKYVNFEREVPPPPLVPAGRYAVGEYVLGTVTADFNGDGALDIATANSDSETVSVLLNNGDGTFRDAVSYAAGRDPFSLAAADLNGDGRPDLSVGNNTGPNGTVSVLLNTGDGSFGVRTAFTAGPNVAVAAVAAGDVNGDGRADVVTANRTDNNAASVSVLLGTGTGALGTPTVYELGQINWGNDVALGDLNGDGKLDVVASALRGLGVLLNNGDGTFQARAESRSVMVGVALADLNKDGKLDLVAETNGLQVELGNDDGTFGPPVQILDVGTSGVAVGDFNRDGNLDIAVTHFEFPNDAGAVLLGNGDGTFRAPVAFAPGPDGGPLAAGDLDGDGWLDLVVGNQEASSVTVLRNRRSW